MAKSKVKPPTLPKNIKKIKIQCDALDSVGVIPNVSPTVPMAEAASIGRQEWVVDRRPK